MSGKSSLFGRWSLVVLTAVLCISCSKAVKTTTVERPAFCGDSAYAYVETQLSFGPRVPLSKGHTDCAVWLVQQLRRAGAQVELQKGSLPDYAGHIQPIINIIGHFTPDSMAGTSQGILLCAHYDTRAWCDEEEIYEDRFYNVPGANDGASGVAVLLEVARQLGAQGVKQPVDIVFFDYEDQGTPRTYTGVQREDTWCLGSQLFAMQYPNRSGRYRFGILLDMVGAPDAVFPREIYSMQYAQNYVELVWRKALALGYGRYFVDKMAYPITDDHYYLNRAGIPCIDIIHYDSHNAAGFANWWHTREDNIQNVDKSTLQAVGEVVLSAIN